MGSFVVSNNRGRGFEPWKWFMLQTSKLLCRWLSVIADIVSYRLHNCCFVTVVAFKFLMKKSWREAVLIYRWIRSLVSCHFGFGSSRVTFSSFTVTVHYASAFQSFSLTARVGLLLKKIQRIGRIWNADRPVAVKALYPLDHGNPRDILEIFLLKMEHFAFSLSCKFVSNYVWWNCPHYTYVTTWGMSWT